MPGVWINLQLGTIIFLVVVLLIAFSNLKAFRRLGEYPRPSRFPRVSVLVPARNEERNIARCVLSLLCQNYPNFEVMVLDDESTDSTWKMLEKLKARHPQLKIIKGKPLPKGWVGKAWASHQLAERASGELLLFTDADTRHRPEALSQAVSAMLSEHADFLTALPEEKALTMGEKLTVPIMSFGILSFLPVRMAHRSSASALCLAVGQFMLFRRSAYQEVGGYEAVKNRVLDDVCLGRMIKAHGLRWRIADAADYVSCRMYENLEEVSEGFSKNLFETFGKNLFIYLPVWLWLTAVFILPVLILGFAMLGGATSETSVLLALITVGLSLLLWGVSHLRFGYPLYLVFLYPASVFLWVLMAGRSMVLSLADRITWKGRRIDVKGGTEETAELENVEEMER